ncbi:hypothetical protein [Aeromicrobium erythreum]|jgi:hypothetical protein|uniref:YCII-related domain-containing protein n=1 Tax=Aeromicrobium erythreum TaxID=2041 RepID=A0A0U4CC03_9ACTN|nr:hypothetical protein [Aeromicrobium erythreum]ALX05451.1 hypothetical protein AERYTH_12470 [Aeromicrobium erythreum]
MSRSTEDAWTVVVYEVSGVPEQQDILADFHTAAMSGVVALGTQGDLGTYVVVECRTDDDAWLVEAVVHQIDPHAHRRSEHPHRPVVGPAVPADG